MRSSQSSPIVSMSKNLVEFAPAGAKKVQAFSSATCASKKILLGLQTCAPSAQADGACAAVRPQTPLSKKEYFFDSLARGQAPSDGILAIFCLRAKETRPRRCCLLRWSVMFIEQPGARGGKPPRKESGLSFISREAQIKDSPLFQHQNKGLSCGVRFHHLRTSFSFLAVHGYLAPHTDSDRCEGKCSFKISHHCVPSPELQNPVCFRSIQYIGLTSKASTEPLL